MPTRIYKNVNQRQRTFWRLLHLWLGNKTKNRTDNRNQPIPEPKPKFYLELITVLPVPVRFWFFTRFVKVHNKNTEICIWGPNVWAECKSIIFGAFLRRFFFELWRKEITSPNEYFSRLLSWSFFLEAKQNFMWSS